MRVYIAGPMRGRPQFNFPAFDAARDRLLAAGHEPLNQADRDRELLCPWVNAGETHFNDDVMRWVKTYFHLDVRDVLRCDAVAVLPGWQDSRLGKAEIYLAIEFGKQILDATTLEPITADVTITGRERFRHPLIGFTGYATSGKDTAADALVDEGWVKLGFADPLYAMTLAMNPLIPMDSAEQAVDFGVDYMVRLKTLVAEVGWTQAKCVREVRRFLQRLGTEAGRNVLDANIWVDLAERRLLPLTAPVCFTNVRFENEVAMIRRHGGYLVRIVRYGRSPAPHTSELQEFEADVSIANDGTIEELKRNVVQWVMGRIVATH